MYYTRAMSDSWLEASSQFPVLLLTGPRQVGKTTLLRHICTSGRRYITLDDPGLRQLATEDPGLFLERFPSPVLIDEIQYAPELLPHIKMQVDREHKAGAFWLTGSQQFRMMRGVSESLAGRVAIMNLLGFSNREQSRSELAVRPFLPTRDCLAEREGSASSSSLHHVYKSIWLGSFPALRTGQVKNWDLFYSSYLQTYLQRDVRELTQVGNETAFLRFLKACAARTGQLLNLTDLARDADISVNTAKKWLSILEASFQIYLLQPYHSNLTKRLVKTPKLYFLDTGMCAYLSEWTSPETLEAGAMSGAVLETYVVSEILKSWWHRGKSPQIFYYRDKDKREIDFLFVQDQTIYPVEVKKSVTPKREWKSIFAPLDRLGLQRSEGGVICLCKESIPIASNVSTIPVGVL